MNLLLRTKISYMFRTLFVIIFREVFYEGRWPQNVVETCRRFSTCIINSHILHELLWFVLILWINAFKLVHLSNCKGKTVKSTVFCSIIEMITLRMIQEVRKRVVNWNKETFSLEVPLLFSPHYITSSMGQMERKWECFAWRVYVCTTGNYVYCAIWRRISRCIELCTLINL